jgi:hypothetical protein
MFETMNLIIGFIDVHGFHNKLRLPTLLHQRKQKKQQHGRNKALAGFL